MENASNVEHGPGSRLVDLTAYDCWGLLDSEAIARVAWNGPDGVAVVPVNYAVVDGAVWFRTNPYTALGRECGGLRVAVEVDHLEPATSSGWSVVVVGRAELAPAPDVPSMLDDLQAWPAGPRALFVRVEPSDVTGRKLLPPAPPGKVSP